MMWDTNGICFYDCIGTDDETFDGNDNNDIATYLVTTVDKKELWFVIRHQCLIPTDELIKRVLKFYKEPSASEFIQVEDIKTVVDHALAMKEHGVTVTDNREKV